MTRHRVNQFTLGSLLDELARSRASQTAVVSGATQHDYATLRRRVVKLANALEAVGVGQGDRVLWLGQNSHRVLEGVLACARLGAMFCPANWRQSASELAFVIDDFQPKVLFWQEEEVGETTAQARQLAQWDTLWVQHDGPSEYETMLQTSDDVDRDRDIDPASPVLVIYTAAFFGRPNGAMLSHTAILCQDLVVQQTQHISRATVFLNSGPMFHVGTLMSTFATFHSGGTNVFARRTEPEALCRLIHDHRCTLAFLVPKSCIEMAALNADGRFDLSCLHSPPVSPEWDAMVSVRADDYRATAYGYGQTEANGLITWVHFCANQGQGAHGAVGPVVQLRIVDHDDAELPAGEVGEIVLRGPTVMNGYWNRPELNAQRQRGGWHHTNDLGRREADGTVTFIGPKTQMIKSGVENIYPAEVEGCLKRHPAVSDAAIIGVPDLRFVQTVKAIVQLKPGASADEAELIGHCRAHLASYKKPASVAFIDALPRQPGGAVDYRALDSAYGGGNYPGGEQRGA